MTAWAIVDTGPLVAYFDARESLHEWAVQFVGGAERVVTCEPVITEALFLLARTSSGIQNVWRMMERGALQIDFRLHDHADSIAALMNKYENLPMSLADACLVRMAEMHPRMVVITTDRHFRIYRTSDRRVLNLRTPGF